MNSGVFRRTKIYFVRSWRPRQERRLRFSSTAMPGPLQRRASFPRWWWSCPSASSASRWACLSSSPSSSSRHFWHSLTAPSSPPSSLSAPQLAVASLPTRGRFWPPPFPPTSAAACSTRAPRGLRPSSLWRRQCPVARRGSWPRACCLTSSGPCPTSSPSSGRARIWPGRPCRRPQWGPCSTR